MNYKSTVNRKMLNLMFGVLVTLLASACSVTNRNSNSHTEPIIAVFAVKDHLPAAFALAKEWQADAYLLTLTVNAKLPHSIPSTEGIEFEFRSPTNKKKILSVFCKKICRSEELATTIELHQCPPLEITDTLLESEKALELGLKNGGSDYVNRESAYISMDLERNYPKCNGSVITWEVRIGVFDSPEQVLLVFDAVSGELLETR